MSRRYEHASAVLNSSKSLEEWGEIFGGDVFTAALIDRILGSVSRYREPCGSFPPSG
jgi:DNA replication protein DnaC